MKVVDMFKLWGRNDSALLETFLLFHLVKLYSFYYWINFCLCRRNYSLLFMNWGQICFLFLHFRDGCSVKSLDHDVSFVIFSVMTFGCFVLRRLCGKRFGCHSYDQLWILSINNWMGTLDWKHSYEGRPAMKFLENLHVTLF